MPIKSYELTTGRKADFRIRYRYFTPEEGGRLNLPFQHIRNDFWYEHPDHRPNQIFMIVPEFLDENGNIIQEGMILREGIANMWIVNPEMFSYHKERIKVGQKGYFHEGPRKTADCEIIEIIGLKEL